MSTSPLHPLLVIGAGPAGIAAAVEAARQGVDALIVDETGTAGGTIHVAHEVRNIPFLPSTVPGPEVAAQLRTFIERWGIEVVQATVDRVRVEPDSIRVERAGGGAWDARALVVASGTRAAHPKIEGLASDFGGPLSSSAVESWNRRHPGTAAVIGGGDVALDQARWLRCRGVRVQVLCRSRSVRAPRWLLDAAVGEGVELVLETRVVRAQESVSGVTLEFDRAGVRSEASFEALVAAVGRVPNVPEGLTLDAPDAAGRVRFAGDVTGRAARHVTAALGDGCVAAAELLHAQRIER